MNDLAPIQRKIYEIRGQKVILDRDLAALYPVETKVLNQAVKRNIERFPEDFMFRLTKEEWENLKSQFVISNEAEFLRSQIVTIENDDASLRSQNVTLYKSGRGSNTKYNPFVFTELGIAMLSSVLNSETAIQANISIMRAFVQVREYLMAATTLSAEIKELRTKVDLLALQQEENLGAVNDLSEDIRQDIDNLYQAIAALSSRIEEK